MVHIIGENIPQLDAGFIEEPARPQRHVRINGDEQMQTILMYSQAVSLKRIADYLQEMLILAQGRGR